MSAKTVEQLLQIVGQLPENRVSEVTDFAQFLLWQETARTDGTPPVEVWAERLAKAKGFDDLTEEDVATIVHESRKSGE